MLGGPCPVDGVAQIDAQLERVGWRYEQGHIAEHKYRSKWEHLQERRRKVLAAIEAVESPVPLEGILDASNQGDPRPVAAVCAG